MREGSIRPYSLFSSASGNRHEKGKRERERGKLYVVWLKFYTSLRVTETGHTRAIHNPLIVHRGHYITGKRGVPADLRAWLVHDYSYQPHAQFVIKSPDTFAGPARLHFPPSTVWVIRCNVKVLISSSIARKLVIGMVSRLACPDPRVAGAGGKKEHHLKGLRAPFQCSALRSFVLVSSTTRSCHGSVAKTKWNVSLGIRSWEPLTIFFSSCLFTINGYPY